MKWKIQENKIRIISWGGLFLIMIAYFVSFYYPDISTTSRFSRIFLDCLKDGNVFQFYEISLQNLDPSLGIGATYYISIYIIFAVWNLPIWIMIRFGNIASDHIFILLWEKGIVLLFAAGCIYVMCRILRKLKYTDFEYYIFLFISSLLFVCPAMVMAQYDVIELFFILCGIYYYLKDEKLFWRSMLFFSIGISVKLFAGFILFLLVLVTEKRIVRIALNMGCSLLFTIITMLPFWNQGYQNCAAEYNNNFMERLFKITFSGGMNFTLPDGTSAGISIFCLLFAVLCVVAYLYDGKSTQENIWFLFWLSAAFFLCFFTFVNCHPQWAVLMVPFWICVSIQHKNNFKINILLEIILEGTLIVTEAMRYNWVYFADASIAGLILKNTGIQLERGAHNLYDVLEYFGLLNYIPGVYAVFVVCGISLLAINNHWKPLIQKTSQEELICAEKIVRIVRVGMIILYLVVTCAIAY